MTKLNRYSKLIVFSISSLLVYFFIENSEKINSVLTMLVASTSSKALGIYVLLILAKYFLLLFGSLGLLMFFYRLVKDKDP